MGQVGIGKFPYLEMEKENILYFHYHQGKHHYNFDEIFQTFQQILPLDIGSKNFAENISICQIGENWIFQVWLLVLQ